MLRTFLGTALVLTAGLTAANATEFSNALVHGIFRPAEGGIGEGAVHPLEPAQKVEGLQNHNTFLVTSRETGEKMAFPVHAGPGAKEPTTLKDFGEDGATFLAALDLTGTGVSDLIYTRKDMPGWKVLSNGARLATPVRAFVVGLHDRDSLKAELIPADTREFKADHDLLAVTGDFLGNGTEQLAYTRPGQTQLWIVGANGVTTMKAELKGIEPTPPGARSHWLFSCKATRKSQRTRIAYYRAGADHLIRLVPKGMEFVQERVPLKGHWERLNQAVLDWPVTAAVAQGKAQEKEQTGPAAPASAGQTVPEEKAQAIK